MSFATRLVAGTLLVLVTAVAVLLWGAERSLRHDLRGDIERSLLSEARLVREALPADSSAWDEAVHRLSRQNGHRITLVDRQGVVRADSDFPEGPLPPLENHLHRPEVQAAEDLDTRVVAAVDGHGGSCQDVAAPRDAPPAHARRRREERTTVRARPCSCG